MDKAKLLAEYHETFYCECGQPYLHYAMGGDGWISYVCDYASVHRVPIVPLRSPFKKE